jgi:DNA-binding transcriptional ArsR family regulator
MVTEAPAVYRAIADPTRRAILDLLRTRELSAGAIAERFPVSRPAIAKHVGVLRKAGLINERREAQLRLYSINPRPLQEVDRWLHHYRVFWAARLHELKDLVEREARRTR